MQKAVQTKALAAGPVSGRYVKYDEGFGSDRHTQRGVAGAVRLM